MWFLRLVRWPNLLIIILTQALLRYCIILPLMQNENLVSRFLFTDFLILTLTTVLIAAAGYIINDYFDLEIDRINKAEKQILGVIIHPRKGIILYWTLNLIAFLTGIYLAFRMNSLNVALLFPVIAGLLWTYSTQLKQKFLAGNVLVALLSAFVLLIVWMFELMVADASWAVLFETSFLNMVVWFYAAFAFMISLGREIIKDIEDMKGDAMAGCRTIPLVLGVAKAKYFSVLISFGTIILLTYAQFLLLRWELNLIFGYYLLVQCMLVYHIFLSLKANDGDDFHTAGNLSKLIMMAGILGMQLFCITLYS